MKLETTKIANGFYIGAKIWICDLRYKDYNNKPIRNVKPTEVLVVNKDKVNKKIYYSECCFLKLNKKGEPLKAIIPLFDNTGYRTCSGVALNCFDNKVECVIYYEEQINKAVLEINQHFEKLKKEKEEKIIQFAELIKSIKKP